MNIPPQIKSAQPLCQGISVVAAQNMKPAERVSTKTEADFALD